MKNKQAKVYIIILNWNGWQDTLECLESVFRNSYENYNVIVCDNDSQDNSIENIQAWANGHLPARIENPTLAHLSNPPLTKPIPYIEINRESAEKKDKPIVDVPLILIRTGANLGFAGGNNVGLRYALTQADFAYAWLLNNDTVIAPDALSHMVARMEESPRTGICGSTLLYYHKPNYVQVLGGACYNKWKFRAYQIGAFQPAGAAIEREQVEPKISYIAGASMLVSHEFLTSIGLMAEDYFLYFEELDWALRAKGYFSLAFAPDSLVYHKEGGSIGTYIGKRRSALSMYYLQRNRVKFVKKFFHNYLFLLYIVLLWEMLRAALRKDFFEIKWTTFALLGKQPGDIPGKDVNPSES